MRWWRILKAKIRNFFNNKRPSKPTIPRATTPRDNTPPSDDTPVLGNGRVYKIPEKLRAEYLANWNRVSINEHHRGRLAYGMNKVKPNFEEYEGITEEIGCNLWLLICSHYREGSCDFDRQILNGQKWWQKTTIVPKGKGPFRNFEESCIAGFNLKPSVEDFENIVDLLHYLERWNGWGYRSKTRYASHGVWSPYLWAGTNLYTKGYYTSDGNFSYRAVNKQLGCATLLKGLFEEYGVSVNAQTGKILRAK